MPRRILALILVLTLLPLTAGSVSAQETARFSWHVLNCSETGCDQLAVKVGMQFRYFPADSRERIDTLITTDSNGWAFASFDSGTDEFFVTPQHQDLFEVTSFTLTCEQNGIALDVSRTSVQTAHQSYNIVLSDSGDVSCESLINPWSSSTETGTIKLRAYMCPYGYADQFYPDTCKLTGSLATLYRASDGARFGEQVVRGEGATFVVQPGQYRLDAGIPGAVSAHGAMNCVSGDLAVEYPVNVDVGKTIECEQFIFPSSGRDNPPDELDLTLTIRARSCDLPIARSEFHDACFGNAVSASPFIVSAYRFDAEVTTDADGNASVDVPDFTLEIDPTGDRFGARVWRFCSTAAHPGVPLLYPLELSYSNSDVTCDIYFIPVTYDLATDLLEAETGTIEVHYRLCPPGFFDTTYYATCHDTAIPETAIDLVSASNGVQARGYTDQTGDVSFRVPPGSWELPPDILGNPEDTYAGFCTDVNDPGNVLFRLKVVGISSATSISSPCQHEAHTRPWPFRVRLFVAINGQLTTINSLETSNQKQETLDDTELMYYYLELSGTFGMSAGLGSGRSSRGCSSLIPLPVSGPVIRGQCTAISSSLSTRTADHRSDSGTPRAHNRQQLVGTYGNVSATRELQAP